LGKQRRATLRDVAEAAGVSVWTASNTFSNPERVAEPTRERVLAAADLLDYAGPNPGARTLALGRTGMVALVAPHDAQPLIADPGAAQVAQGLLAVCDRAGLSLVLAGHDGEHAVDGRVFLRNVPGAGVRGPVVLVDTVAEGTPSVHTDAASAAGALARLLLDLGHRRIAVIAGPGEDDRLSAAGESLQGMGPISVYRTTGTPWPTDAHGEVAARQALRANPRPTAILALSDPLALGALDAARQMGLRVPDDVSIAGIDDLPGSDDRGLTTALVPYRPMGELAGRVLLARIAGDPPPPLTPLPAPLVIRATTAPPPSQTDGSTGKTINPARSM
jgi:DNA-binding LacI/PurR family transcriptional regulator